jgi:hypothetical protein
VRSINEARQRPKGTKRVDDRDGVLSRLGGTFLCVLTLILVVGDGALMVTGTLPVPWGVGFLVLYLFGHTAFVQVLGAIAQTRNCVSSAKTDLRLFHIQHDNDLRTHLGRLAEGINRVSELTTQGVKDDLIAEIQRTPNIRPANPPAPPTRDTRTKGQR